MSAARWRLLAAALLVTRSDAQPPSVYTTVIFYNVASCPDVTNLKFDFQDGVAEGSGEETMCPAIFRTPGNRCQVQGPYGRAVVVKLAGVVETLDIRLLNPSEEDAELAASTFVQLSTDSQRRNLIGSTLRASTSFEDCSEGIGFQVVAEPDQTIPTGFFRAAFRHMALGVDSADVRVNGDNLVTRLSPGERFQTDHRLMGSSDMPDPVSMTFDVDAESAQDQAPRLFSTICEQSTVAYVLYGYPPTLPLRLLRVDDADEVCAYDDSKLNKFEAELTIYNAMPEARNFVFGFGLSQFLPRSGLNQSTPLGYREVFMSRIRQPGDVYARVFDADTGQDLAGTIRVLMHPQRRNIIGASLGVNGSLVLDSLQSTVLPHAKAEASTTAVPAGHFRMLFVHAASGLPQMSVTIDDDIDLLTLAPGEMCSLDYELIAPHTSGQLVKFAATSDAGESASNLVDLSTLCEGAAYVHLLGGTPSGDDEYDPLLMRVDGTGTACTLPPSPVVEDDTAPLVLINLHPSGRRVIFNYGRSLLQMTKSTRILGYGERVLTEVPVGELYIRLREETSPYAQLVPPSLVTIRAQARNVMVALDASATGSGASTDSCTQASSSALEDWRLVALGSQDQPIPATQTRLLLLNALTDGCVPAHCVATSASLTTTYSQSIALTPGTSSSVLLAGGSTAQLQFRVTSSSAAPSQLAPITVSVPANCDGSALLAVVAGQAGCNASGAFGPTVISLDSDDMGGNCVAPIVPTIPPATELPERTTIAPVTETNYDFTGLGAGPFEAFSGAAAGGPQASWTPAILTLVSLISVSLSWSGR